MQYEGLLVMHSFVHIMNKLPGTIHPKLEKYCHPAIFDQNPQRSIQQGMRGDFIKAIEQNKTLVCPVISKNGQSQTHMRHAMVMYNLDGDDFVFKNSYLHQPVKQIPITECNPKIGYYIRL